MSCGISSILLATVSHSRISINIEMSQFSKTSTPTVQTLHVSSLQFPYHHACIFLYADPQRQQTTQALFHHSTLRILLSRGAVPTSILYTDPPHPMSTSLPTVSHMPRDHGESIPNVHTNPQCHAPDIPLPTLIYDHLRTQNTIALYLLHYSTALTLLLLSLYLPLLFFLSSLISHLLDLSPIFITYPS